MKNNADQTDAPVQTLPVYPAEALHVIEGIARNEALGFGDELMLEDTYKFDPAAPIQPFSLQLAKDGRTLLLAPGTGSGSAGNIVHLDCCITLLAPDGRDVEVLVLVEIEDGGVEGVTFLPLSPLDPSAEYRLVRIDHAAAAPRFADLCCTAFLAGTRITRASGEQVEIEKLRPATRC